MTTARSAIITLALALLLWPLAAQAAPAPVSGTITINPPLLPIANSRARFFLTPENARPGDFGVRVGILQSVNAQTFDYSFPIPEGSFTPGVNYRLNVYVQNGTREARAGWTRVSPTGGTRLDFAAGAYSGSLPPDSAGTMLLLLGVILAAIAMIFTLWRQLRRQALARQPGMA